MRRRLGHSATPHRHGRRVRDVVLPQVRGGRHRKRGFHRKMRQDWMERLALMAMAVVLLMAAFDPATTRELLAMAGQR